jgi:hypothetical protein
MKTQTAALRQSGAAGELPADREARTSTASSSRFSFRSADQGSISRLKEGAQRARHGFGLIEGSQMAAVGNDLQAGM